MKVTGRETIGFSSVEEPRDRGFESLRAHPALYFQKVYDVPSVRLLASKALAERKFLEK